MEDILTDEHSRAEHSRPPSTQRAIENDGQRFVGDNIAQQESNQDPMFPSL
jgi:hypothetical protein